VLPNVTCCMFTGVNLYIFIAWALNVECCEQIWMCIHNIIELSLNFITSLLIVRHDLLD
jgi:hypothetical protein